MRRLYPAPRTVWISLGRSPFLELAPEVRDVGVHHVGLRVERHVPHLLEQGRPGHDPFRIEQEEFEQAEFPRREIHRPPAPLDHPAQAIHFQVLVAEDAGGRPELPPGERTHPRQQLLQGKGLGEVVIRARVEAANHVLGRVPRGQHQDRSLHPRAPQLGGQLEAVHLRQLDVEQDQVVLIHVGQVATLGTVPRGVDGMALLLERLPEETGHRVLILHHQHAHQASQQSSANPSIPQSLNPSILQSFNPSIPTPSFPQAPS